MPPKKKPRRFSPDFKATAWRSSRPNRGVGDDAAQLQKLEKQLLPQQGNDRRVTIFKSAAQKKSYGTFAASEREKKCNVNLF
jgi:hypothetical protein